MCVMGQFEDKMRLALDYFVDFGDVILTAICGPRNVPTTSALRDVRLDSGYVYVAH